MDRSKCHFVLQACVQLGQFIVCHEFCITEQADDLSLTSGEIVYLLEKIDAEWYRGKCRNQTGIFPANYVKVVVSGVCLFYLATHSGALVRLTDRKEKLEAYSLETDFSGSLDSQTFIF